MKITWLIALSILAIIASNHAVTANQNPYYAPSPGPTAVMMVTTGTIVGWSRGNAQGNVGIANRAGVETDYLQGKDATINNQVINCYRAPLNGATPDPNYCGTGNWPSDLIVGSTKVLLFYWSQTTPFGQQVLVTNRLLYGPALLQYETLHRKRRS